jgi:hypothetical protein
VAAQAPPRAARALLAPQLALLAPQLALLAPPQP